MFDFVPIFREITLSSVIFLHTRYAARTGFTVSHNLRSGVPYIFCRGGKVRLIQLLDYLSVASPESGLFSDWSRNKKVLRTEP